MFKFLCLDNPRKKYVLSIEGDGGNDGGANGGGTVIDEGADTSQDHNQNQNNNEGQNRVQHVPYERFSQVTRKNQELAKELAEYRKFGDTKTLAEQIARSKELSTGHRFTETEVKALEEDLKQVPALKQVFEFVQGQSAEREENSKQFVEAAASKVSTLIQSVGIDIKDPKERQQTEFDVQAIIAERIKQTPGWLSRWKRGDMSVVEEAFKRVSGVMGWKRRSTNANTQAKKTQQNSRPGFSGSAPQSNNDKDGYPRTPEGRIDERAVLARASEKGFARLKAGEE